MKKVRTGESKAHRFFSGKGFYVVLAVSLIAVGGAAWLGVNSAINKLENSEPAPQEQTSQLAPDDTWGLPSDFNVAAPQSGIQDKPQSSEATVSKPMKQDSQNANSAVAQGFIIPIKGEIINEYSGDKVVKSKTLDDWVMHTGVDISAEVGTPVKAMSSGKVTEVKNDDLWGTTVTIDHGNGITSFYANLKSAVEVKQGQRVKLGDVLGAVGETADIERAEKSHLHFGVKRDGEWINPYEIAK